MKYFALPIILLVACLSSSCEKDETIAADQKPGYASPLHTAFELQDTGQAAPLALEYRLGSFKNTDAPMYNWEEGGLWSSIAPAAFTTTIRDYSSYDVPTPLFSLTFRALDVLENDYWWQEKASILFSEGKVYPFGEGPGQVDVSAVFMPFSTTDNKPSKASYLINPEGELHITKIEDYSYQDYFGEWTEGKLIHCTFWGKLGKYDRDAHLSSGEMKFRTEVPLALSNGTAVFFITAH